jgi:hypothetical protein
VLVTGDGVWLAPWPLDATVFTIDAGELAVVRSPDAPPVVPVGTAVLATVVGVAAVVVFGEVADVVATGWRCVPVDEPTAALEDVVPELAPPVPDPEDSVLSPEVSCETAEVACDAAPCTTDPVADRAVGADLAASGLVSVVAACACLENTSMITKIPAATIASCAARRAMRRAMGCVMTALRSPDTRDHCSATTVQRIPVSGKRRWMTPGAHRSLRVAT